MCKFITKSLRLAYHLTIKSGGKISCNIDQTVVYSGHNANVGGFCIRDAFIAVHLLPMFLRELEQRSQIVASILAKQELIAYEKTGRSYYIFPCTCGLLPDLWRGVPGTNADIDFVGLE